MLFIFLKILNTTEYKRQSKITNTVLSLYSPLVLITKEIKQMKIQFENSFIELIRIYKQFNIDIIRNREQEILTENYSEAVTDPYLLKKTLHDLFFDHLISFYDKFSSKINYMIHELTYIRKKDISNIKRNLDFYREIFYTKRKLDVKTIELTEYPTFEYFVLRLEKIVGDQMGLIIQNIRNILYYGYDMELFYNTIELWRRCNGSKFQSFIAKNVETAVIIDVNLPENIDYVSYFRAILSLDVMKEFSKVKNPESDLRFMFLVRMIKKYGDYNNIPNVNCKPPCKCPKTKSGEVCNGERIRQKYFKYIDYFFPEKNYAYIYSKALKQRAFIIRHYNKTILRDKIKRYITQ
ncbi:hypothetical protein CDIK_2222 [Cucumispora dikerogammari]|nr:hypothetical protein CDIK_2222 [Cucumispora dikerogammari]